MSLLGAGGGSAAGCRAIPAAAFLVAAACAAPRLEAPAPELRVEWRGYELHSGPRALVLASTRRAARDAYERLEEALVHLDRAGVDTGRGLVLAVERGDAPLLPDERELWAALARWNTAATGSGAEAAAELGPESVSAAVLVKAVTAALPPGEETLALPAALLEEADWVVVVPTGNALAMVSFEIVVAAIDRSWIDRVCALSSTRFTLDRRRIKRELLAYQRARICAAVLAAAPQDAHRDEAAADAALRASAGAFAPLTEPLDRRLAQLATIHLSRYWNWAGP